MNTAASGLGCDLTAFLQLRTCILTSQSTFCSCFLTVPRSDCKVSVRAREQGWMHGAEREIIAGWISSYIVEELCFSVRLLRFHISISMFQSSRLIPNSIVRTHFSLPFRRYRSPTPISFVQRTHSSSNTGKMSYTNESKSQEKKSYHTKATGAALATVKQHSKEHSLKLYGGCFW